MYICFWSVTHPDLGCDINTKPQYQKPEFSTNSLIKTLTKEENEEMRRKSLCIWCNQKFERGHAYLKSQLYHLLIDESTTQEGELDEYLDCVDNLDVGD